MTNLKELQEKYAGELEEEWDNFNDEGGHDTDFVDMIRILSQALEKTARVAFEAGAEASYQGRRFGTREALDVKVEFFGEDKE